MSDPAALKALSRETKALILVSEFEARRMPMFQMRAVLAAIIVNDEEKKLIIDLVERDLRATGYPSEHIAAFLGVLITAIPSPSPGMPDQSVMSTRRLRSPFALGFEAGGDESAADPLAKPPTRGLTGVVQFAPAPPSKPAPNAPPTPRASYSFDTPAVETPPAANSPAPKPAVTGPASPVPKASNPTPAQGTRRGTFVFEGPPRPASGTPSPPAGTAKPPEPSAPVGTTEWRREMAFGKLGGAEGGTRRSVVLIADDDKRIRMVFRLRIEEAGMTVVECGTGDEAWARIQQGDLALVVLDMKMPGLHGLEILSHMADKQISLPVVVCSAYDQLQDEFVIRTHVALRYLVKPVAPEALVAAIRELLAPKS